MKSRRHQWSGFFGIDSQFLGWRYRIKYMASLICCTYAGLIGVLPSLKINIKVPKYLILSYAFEMRSDVIIEGIEFIAAISSAAANSVAPKAFEILLVGFLQYVYSTRNLKSPKWEIDCKQTFIYVKKIPSMGGL